MEHVDEICKRKYPVIIHWIDEGEGGGYYFAYLPDWGYSTVSATAETELKALIELEEVKRSMAQHFLDTGKSIPNVSCAPFEKLMDAQHAIGYRDCAVKLQPEIDALKKLTQKNNELANELVLKLSVQESHLHAKQNSINHHIEENEILKTRLKKLENSLDKFKKWLVKDNKMSETMVNIAFEACCYIEDVNLNDKL